MTAAEKVEILKLRKAEMKARHGAHKRGETLPEEQTEKTTQIEENKESMVEETPSTASSY